MDANQANGIRRTDGNPGKPGFNPFEPVLPDCMPECPGHLEGEARTEWFRVVGPLHEAGVLRTVDNKQMELMGRYMAELGITPASRSRVVVDVPGPRRSRLSRRRAPKRSPPRPDWKLRAGSRLFSEVPSMPRRTTKRAV